MIRKSESIPPNSGRIPLYMLSIIFLFVTNLLLPKVQFHFGHFM